VTRKVLFGLGLLWVCLAAAYQHIPSADLWWLLADGRLIAETGSIPSQDPFSWSAPGAPWHNDQWLCGWLAFQVYRVTGLEGLHLIKALLLAATLGLLLDTGRRLRPDGNWGWLAPALAITLLSAEGRFFFDVRAYLFTYFCLALLWRWLQLRERLHPLAVFVLFVFWANLHGGVSSGLLVLGLEAVFSQKERRIHLLTMTALAFLAACCNPSGIWLLLHPFLLLGSPWGRYLNEWAPVWRRPDIFAYELVSFGLWAVLAMVKRQSSASRDMHGVGLNPDSGKPSLEPGQARWDHHDKVLAALAVFSLTGWRHIPLFALLALPRWCVHLRGSALSWQACWLGLILWAGVKPLSIADPGQTGESQFFPQQACNWLSDHPLPRKMFHPYGLGGYLLWRGWPVGIDGRAVQVYPWHCYRDYLNVALERVPPATPRAPERFDAYCRQNGIQVAMLFSQQKEAGLWLVEGNKRWRPVYQDELVTIVVTEEVR